MTRRRLAPLIALAAACGEPAERGAPGPDDGAPPAGEEAPEQNGCPAAPTTTVPLLTLGGEVALHWPLAKGCVDVTYAPAAAPFLDQLDEALSAWSALDCSRLCFTAPAEVAEADPDRRHVIHVTAEGDQTRATPRHDGPSGTIVSASVNISPTAPPTTRALTAALGLALGLGRPTAAGVDSVMHTTAAAASPTSTDAEAFCALYGSPGYCQD